MTFVLDATTRALKITIDAGAGADVQFVATYADSTSTTFTKGSSQGASNGSTAVDVVPAPVASTRRVVKAISFYNANATDPRTVTFYYDDNGTAYTIAKFTLQAGQSWYSETASTEEKGATILDATNRTIQFSIDTAGADVQYTAAWADSTDSAFTQGSSRGLSNGTSAVTIVGAPAASTRRLVQSLTFYNAHASSTRVVTLFYDDNGTARTIAKFSLLAGESWFSEVATFGFQPAGSVLAAPAATAGPPSFRVLSLTDLATVTGSGSVVLQTTPTIITPRIDEIRAATTPFRAVLSFVQAANSANYLQLTNAATGAGLGPILETIGTGADINFELKSKGTGNIVATTAGFNVKPLDSTVSGVLTILGGSGTSAGGQLVIRTNGTNEIGFRAPDGLAASVYYVLPGADGTSGQVLSTNGSGVLSWTAGGGAGVTDGDKGDITVSGSGATWTIDSGVVTLAKMADLVTDRLIGRDSSGTGAPEALTVGGGIEFTGSGGIQTSAFTGDVTKAAGGTALTIANDAVTFAKMQNVTSGNLLGRTTASPSTGDVEEITPGTGVLAWLQTPTSTNLATAMTDETGTGSLVFATSPTLTTPRIAVIHTASSPNNAALGFAQVASSVNYLQITNAATGVYPILEAIGTDTDIGMVLKTKGTGYLQIDADRIETFGGDLFIYDNRSLVLFETSNVDFISIGAPSSLSVSTSYTLPANAGSSGQFLTTNGTGTLSWSNQTTTLSGDVTGSGTTAITTTIANNAVTFPKFRQIDTDTLVGRDTALTGNAEMIAVTGGIEFSGSGSIRTTAFTGDVTKTAGGTALTIADNAVTYAKMQNVTATSRVLGRKSSGSGDPEECTLSEVLDFVGTPTPAQGDLLYRGASTWTRLGADTAGRVLRTRGTGANPEWVSLPGSKNLLINGDMSVAQRGTSFSSTTTPANNDRTYLLDRWYLLSDGNNRVTVARSTIAPTGRMHSCELKVVSGQTNRKFGIAQLIEQRNCRHVVGSKVSLSFQVRISNTRLSNMRAAVYAWNGTADTFTGATRDIVDSWQDASSTNNPTSIANFHLQGSTPVSLAIPAANTWYQQKIENIQINATAGSPATDVTNIAVFIWSNAISTQADDAVYISDVQLEPGEVATEYDVVPYDVQEARCQRYLPIGLLNNPGQTDHFFGTGQVYDDSKKTCLILINPNIRPRIAPTSITLTAANFDVYDITTKTIGTVTGVVSFSGGFFGCLLGVTATNQLTNADMVFTSGGVTFIVPKTGVGDVRMLLGGCEL